MPPKTAVMPEVIAGIWTLDVGCWTLGVRTARNSHSSSAQHQSASVLILALWTLFFLAALALAAGSYVSANIELARGLRDGSITRLAARAGVEKAIALTLVDSNGWDATTESWCNDQSAFKDVAVGDHSFSVTHTFLLPDGGIATNYGVADEERRINVSLARQSLLAALVEVAGETDGETAENIAASIVDWVDEDHDPLTGGAEKDYYAARVPSYPCHNGKLQSGHELRLVRGMEPELFSKIEDHLTIFGTGKVNINTAGRVVLTCVGISRGGDRKTAESLARKIVAFREGGNVFDEATDDIRTKLNNAVALTTEELGLLSRMMKGSIAIQSTCFRGTASGRTGASGAHGVRIEFAFDRTTKQKLYWHER